METSTPYLSTHTHILAESCNRYYTIVQIVHEMRCVQESLTNSHESKGPIVRPCYTRNILQVCVVTHCSNLLVSSNPDSILFFGPFQLSHLLHPPLYLFSSGSVSHLLHPPTPLSFLQCEGAES